MKTIAATPAASLIFGSTSAVPTFPRWSQPAAAAPAARTVSRAEQAVSDSLLRRTDALDSRPDLAAHMVLVTALAGAFAQCAYLIAGF